MGRRVGLSVVYVSLGSCPGEVTGGLPWEPPQGGEDVVPAALRGGVEQPQQEFTVSNDGFDIALLDDAAEPGEVPSDEERLRLLPDVGNERVEDLGRSGVFGQRRVAHDPEHV